MGTVAGAALLVFVMIVFGNYRDGTLRQWFGAKFLNRAAPPPAGAGRVRFTAGDTPAGGPPSPGAALAGWVPPVASAGALLGSLSPGQRYGAPRDGGSRQHDGLDFAVPVGTPVRASAAGRVTFAGTSGGYGLRVDVDHGGGVVSRYAHLHRIGVRVGDTVAAGQQLGQAGNTGTSTGPHLHWEVRRNGVDVDPTPYLGLGRGVLV